MRVSLLTLSATHVGAALVPVKWSKSRSYKLGLSAQSPAGTEELVAGRITKGIPLPPKFGKDFSKPMSIPQEGIDAAVAVMREGRLFRYSATSAETSQVARAEKEFAELVDQKYAVGVNSCSSAILLAMQTCGVEPGDEVITNGFTFTAIPSTIMRLGAKPVLVECTPDWTMDLDDLEAKMSTSPNAKVLVLSHMRGKICDMDRVTELCKKNNMTLIEDCAHACGILWDGRQQGFHSKVACYSCQSDKVINAGEGGFVTTDDDEIAAKLIYLSGAYEKRYAKHLVRPIDDLCEEMMMAMPNLSVRMSELTAAVMRPLIRNLEGRVQDYNRRWDATVGIIEGTAGEYVTVPRNHPRVRSVGDHLNFFLTSMTSEQNDVFAATCCNMGVPVASFVSPVNARYHKNWRKFGAPAFHLPKTDSVLSFGYDLKMPPHFEDGDFEHIGRIIAYAAAVASGSFVSVTASKSLLPI